MITVLLQKYFIFIITHNISKYLKIYLDMLWAKSQVSPYLPDFKSIFRQKKNEILKLNNICVLFKNFCWKKYLYYLMFNWLKLFILLLWTSSNNGLVRLLQRAFQFWRFFLFLIDLLIPMCLYLICWLYNYNIILHWN